MTQELPHCFTPAPALPNVSLTSTFSYLSLSASAEARCTVSLISSPGCRWSRSLNMSSENLMGLSSMDTTMSPKRPPRTGLTPAASAGPPGTTLMTMMPSSCSSSAMTSGAKTMPKKGRRTKPFEMMLSTFLDTVSMGMARPTPAKVPLPLNMAVLTPTTLPSLLSNGPPLLPGLMEASVWMTPLIGLPPALSMVRETPLTIPRLKLCSRPKGLPKA
mmetsp:Transcript_66303/g.153993  ORF Transcript_66303/g.153993 Transcript_66303/m.153993 type:complete len:217 (-) Transcript_66303:784-1434(-)